MKKILLILALISNLVWAECDVRSASTLTNQRQVGPVTDLVKTSKMGTCTVKFNITVDGKTYPLHETETGLEQEASLCYYAVERARKNLLLNLGGNFQTEAVTVCKEGTSAPPKIKIGDTILESEVGKSKIEKYFTHKNARCRMFTERYNEDRDLKVYHGVICQIDNSDTNWIVVDKW